MSDVEGESVGDDKGRLLLGSSLLILSVVSLSLSVFLFGSPKEGGSDILGNTGRVVDILARYPVSFAPRGFCGRGDGTRSYAYGLAWGAVSVLLLVASVYLFVITYDENVVFSKEEVSEIFLGCVLVFASLVYCCVWLPLFRLFKPWAFACSFGILILAFSHSLIGSYLLFSWGRGAGFGICVGLGVGSLSGWLLVALALNASIAVSAYSQAPDDSRAEESRRRREGGASNITGWCSFTFCSLSALWPTLLSLAALVFASLVSDPGHPFPLLFLLLFNLPEKFVLAILLCIVGILIPIGTLNV